MAKTCSLREERLHIKMYLTALTAFLLATLCCCATFGQNQLPFSSELTTQQVPVSQTIARGWPSDAWRPIILTTCFPGLHNESATCRRVPNLIYAEELLYPDFRIRLPYFVNEEQKRIYLKVLSHLRHAWTRGRQIGDYGYFLNQRGQNLLYANVTYSGKPIPGIWSDEACMAYGADKHASAFPPWDGNKDDAPAAVFLASPDDYSFQHFSDRVAMMMAQTRHLIKNMPDGWKFIISPRLPATMVEQLWEALVPGFKPDSWLPAGRLTQLRTRLLLYPCQTPLIHPYTHQLFSELVQEAAGFDPKAVPPIDSRRVVLFLARRGSRTWYNQEECRGAIESLLRQRAQGEELLVFSAEDYPTLTDIVALGRRVKLMVGVHGGAFYNMVFMQPGTALVEICPVAANEESSRCGLAFWEMSSVRNMQYWSVVATNTTMRWEVLGLDCGLVTFAVQRALVGLETARSPLEPFHQGTRFRRQQRRRRRQQ